MAIKPKVVKPEPVSVGAKLRKAHAWFDDLAARAKADAIKDRRRKERGGGPQFSPARLTELATEIEEIQRQINPLENRRAEIAGMLLAHWGHTGVEEIESPLGNTLISTSFELAVDPGVLHKSLGDALWQKMTARILQAPLLIAEGKKKAHVRDAIAKAVSVRRLKVSVTPPGSRRPKSGASDRIEDEAA